MELLSHENKANKAVYKLKAVADSFPRNKSVGQSVRGSEWNSNSPQVTFLELLLKKTFSGGYLHGYLSAKGCRETVIRVTSGEQATYVGVSKAI